MKMLHSPSRLSARMSPWCSLRIFRLTVRPSPVPREPFGFGGWNDSCFGAGNITGWDGYRFWTRQRKITSKWALQRDQNWMS